MVAKKKTTEITETVEIEEPKESLILRVMDKDTKQILKIDANAEKDYKTKYLHVSGKEFE